jgi:hypothetical protein
MTTVDLAATLYSENWCTWYDVVSNLPFFFVMTVMVPDSDETHSSACVPLRKKKRHYPFFISILGRAVTTLPQP